MMHISKHKRSINLLVLQFGAAIAVPFAGYVYSRFRKQRKPRPSLPPLYLPSSDHGCRGVLDKPISKEEEFQKKSKDDSADKEFEFSVCKNDEAPRSDDACEKEIMQLINTITMLQERERDLEAKLLEYYALKEQQKIAKELRNRLKLNQMETRVYNMKMESLKAENEKLKNECSEHAKVLSELKAANYRVQVLKNKLQIEAQRNREQILALRDRVAKLQEQELKACLPKPDAEISIQRSRELLAEIDELRDYNTRLRIENSEISEKLQMAQVLANSKVEESESEALREEHNGLKNENEQLKREIEKIQADRCADLEELVYMRWINACLRFELRNYNPSSGKILARDLSTNRSPRSEVKAKQLILEYAQNEGFDERRVHLIDLDDEDSDGNDRCSSSFESLNTDSEKQFDDSSIDTSMRGKSKKGGNKKLLHGKEVYLHKDSMPRRLSSRHSMDFQKLMRNKAEELKEDAGTEPSSEKTRRTELKKFAEALMESGSGNKKHKKSVSYIF